MTIQGQNPQSYLGVRAPFPPNIHNDVRAPLATDYQNFVVGDFWVDHFNKKAYVLVNILQNVATWVFIGGVPANMQSLSDNAGTLVFPTAAGNIQLAAGAGIQTTSNPGANLITISLTGGGTAIDQIAVDASTAPGTNPVLPAANGQITITGAQVVAGTTANAVRTNSVAANAFRIDIQRSQAVGASTVGDNGVSHFFNTHFIVDGNGFVSSQTATTAQIGIVTLATNAQTQFGTYGTNQVVQAQNITSMLAIPAPIGSTTPNTGTFTNLASTTSAHFAAAALDTNPTISTVGSSSNTNTHTAMQFVAEYAGVTTAGFGVSLDLLATNTVGTQIPVAELQGAFLSPTSGAETSFAVINVSNTGLLVTASCKFFKNKVTAASTNFFEFESTGVQMRAGAGSPDGVVQSPKGSFYLRTDGSSTSTRAYINTDGVTAWTSVTTAT